MLAFGLSSFGFVFPVYLFCLLNRICKNTIKVSKNLYKFDPISILLISYICIYMFRWTGFTAGPLLGLLCLMPKNKVRQIYIEALVKSEFLIRLNDSKVKAEYVVKPPKNPKTIKFLVSSEIIFFSKNIQRINLI